MTTIEAPPGDRLSLVFAALSDPTRRAILVRLTRGDATVSELAGPFDMSQPAVSKHLRVLENAGLISRSKVATSRYSHLEARPLKEATEWMDKQFWNESFDRLDAALTSYLGSSRDAAENDQHDNEQKENEQ
jgi:DNA-binding transcriptional ArsR family regulator